MVKLTKKALLKHFNRSDKEDIIRELLVLFDTYKNVREFYAAELTDASNPLLERYKKKITVAYAVKNPKERTTNLNVNKFIKEFKKTSIYTRDLADLMLHRVECGILAFRQNINRSATFYNCIATTFEDAVKLISSDESINEFEQRITGVLKDSEPGKYNIQKRLKEIIKDL